MFICCLSMEAQNDPPTSTPSEINNPPPRIASTNSIVPKESNFLSSEEFWLSLMVLAFGILITFLATYLIKSRAFGVDQTIKFVIIILVITASLFLITAGFNAEQITPIIGLLGTIIGYLLSSNNNRNTPNNP